MTKTTREIELDKNGATLILSIGISLILLLIFWYLNYLYFEDRINQLPQRVCYNYTIVEKVVYDGNWTEQSYDDATYPLNAEIICEENGMEVRVWESLNEKTVGPSLDLIYDNVYYGTTKSCMVRYVKEHCEVK